MFRPIAKVLILYIAIVHSSNAQETLTQINPDDDSLSYGLKTSGSVDIYYRIGSTEAPTQTFLILEDRKLGLGSFNYLMEYDQKRFGAVLHLAAGPRSEQFYNVDENKYLKYIRQSYLYFNINSKIKLNGGTLVAMPGYEVDEPNQNPIYSTSYLNTLTPAIYTGLWATYQMGEKWNLLIGGFNDTDRRIDKVKGKHLGTMLSYENGDLKASLANFNGRETYGYINVTDLLIDYQVNGKNKLALEILNNYIDSDGIDNSFNGVNLYYSYIVNGESELNFRADYLRDKNGFGYGIEENALYGLTAGFKFNLFDKLILIPEFRIDTASYPTFNNADGGLDRESGSFILGLSYVWD